MLLRWKAPRWYVRFRLLTFADPFVGTCVFRLRTVFRLRAAAPVERARSGRSHAKNFELPTHSQFLVQHRCARFWFSKLSAMCTFRKLNTGDLRPLQQFGIFFVHCGTGFVWIVDFFCILYAFLKNYICTKSIEPILQNLFFRTYPLEPILQNLSSNTYPPIDFV